MTNHPENKEKAESDRAETDLGRPDDYASYPASVTVEGEPYWLVRGEEGDYRLLSAICPHAGGDVLALDEVFFCPLHFWTFDLKEGVCQSVQGERLMQRRAELRADGRLYAVGPKY